MLWAYQRPLGMPRVAAIEFPFGRPFGNPGDTETQRAVLWSALQLLDNTTVPGHVEHLPYVWPEEPKKTDWHPPEPSPVVARMIARKNKQKV
jgi:hypothetical protein